MDKHHEEKIIIMKKYLKNISTGDRIYLGHDEISNQVIENAIKYYASGLDISTIIGIYDTTLFGTGKNGFVFTDDRFYYLDFLGKPIKIWYDDIKNVSLNNTENEDSKRVLEILQYDGEIIRITSSLCNKTPLKEFLNIMKEFDNNVLQNKESLIYNKKTNNGKDVGGIVTGNYKTVNKQYDEEKFHARQGHGFAAERANNLYDNLTGHDAKIVGDDNAKNGADRVVDGIYIQSKYCQTGKRCINECFDKDGQFKYMIDGKPMQIEVPSDKYDEAVNAMKEKIRNGQVKGVTDENEAKNIVRKGHFTYAQAKNIAKAGTVESLTYDSVNGIITAASAFGVTVTISFATSIWNGEDTDTALKIAAYSGLKVGGTAFITSVLASQLSKMGLNSALVSSSEAIVSMLGPKASAVLINAFRIGSKPIYGAAAMKSAAKLLRSNAITTSITFVVLSTHDVADIFNGKISGKQFVKNVTKSGVTIGAGTVGYIAGAAAGANFVKKILRDSNNKCLKVASVAAGLVASTISGSVANKVADSVANVLMEDDADKMIKIIQDVFTELASEYLLSAKEAEKSIDKLKDKLDEKVLKNMFASNNREEFARDLLIPIIENETKKRKHISNISTEQMVDEVREILEDICDETKSNDETDADNIA